MNDQCLEQIMKLLKESIDINNQEIKIQFLKEEIQNNRYETNAKRIAELLLEFSVNKNQSLKSKDEILQLAL